MEQLASAKDPKSVGSEVLLGEEQLRPCELSGKEIGSDVARSVVDHCHDGEVLDSPPALLQSIHQSTSSE